MLTQREKAFLDRQRVARLATADARGAPHVVPVCFVLDGTTFYITIDEKPKRSGVELKRLRNIRENAQVAVVADRYAEDWTQLAWVMLRGRAEILEPGLIAGKTSEDEHRMAQSLLKARYSQYARMSLAGLPVIAVRIENASSWGHLDT